VSQHRGQGDQVNALTLLPGWPGVAHGCGDESCPHARRGEARQTSEDRQLLDYAIAKGEGGMYLHLSPEQDARLSRSRRNNGIWASYNAGEVRSGRHRPIHWDEHILHRQ
jgi:hypothetical protein